MSFSNPSRLLSNPPRSTKSDSHFNMEFWTPNNYLFSQEQENRQANDRIIYNMYTYYIYYDSTCNAEKQMQLVDIYHGVIVFLFDFPPEEGAEQHPRAFAKDPQHSGGSFHHLRQQHQQCLLPGRWKRSARQRLGVAASRGGSFGISLLFPQM